MMFTNMTANSLSALLNSFKADSVEKIWSISAEVNYYDRKFIAVIYHADGFVFHIVSNSQPALIESVQKYLNPWRQKEA